MASPYQQQALRRKLIYIGLIVGLFTVAGVFRLTVVEAKAEALSLREQNLGEVEVGGSALELSLTGLRGFVVCGLWNWAIDAQKMNRWNEMELYVETLTRLQPHFISPWIFQSWNFAYNVSVEADQVKDKYYYVSRGVHLLQKGERKNHCNPDMRFNIGYYQQHKVMQSDETNVFRCLFQMSSIPPPERDIDRLMPQGPNGQRALDVDAFAKFCAAHPQLVRRLRDKLRCNRPEDVVRFLDENKRIPAVYKDDPNEVGAEWSQGRYPLKDIPDRFPALPPPRKVRDEELSRATGPYDYYPNEVDYNTIPDDGFDAFAASRAWSGYAHEALPPPDPEVPGEPGPITDRTRQRKSKMTVNLFRNHAPRSETYVGERLQDEGWFGPEGWLITGWFENNRFPNGQPSKVGTEQNWAQDTWNKAAVMWEKRGRASLMLLDEQTLAEKHLTALKILKPANLEVGRMPPGPEPKPDDPMYEPWKAAVFLFHYYYSTHLTNFKHFYYTALVEAKPEMIDARRTIFNARSAVRRGQRQQAADHFESETGLPRLRQVLLKNKEFQQDPFTQEDLFELEVRYIQLMHDKNGGDYKQLMAVGSLWGAGFTPQAPVWSLLPCLAPFEQDDKGNGRWNARLMAGLPVPEFVPAAPLRLEDPDPADPTHTPLIAESQQMLVKVRRGLMKAPEAKAEEMREKMQQRAATAGGQMPAAQPPGQAPAQGPPLKR
jgi:hypothetical protein